MAFVVQRCGDDIFGGAERLCLASARAMSDEWTCEILTTCARSSETWRNVYPPGATTIGGIVATRFAVDAERDRTFDLVSARIVRGGATRVEERAWLRSQGPYAPGLLRHLETDGHTYDCVFFFSYLYATTFFGLAAVRDRAVIVPLAHDEWMLRVATIGEVVFHHDLVFAFVTPEERHLVESRFGKRRGVVLDVAIEAPSDVDPALFRERFEIPDAFALCVGRVDPAKGSDTLVERFAALHRRGRTQLRLVLAGPVAEDFRGHIAGANGGTVLAVGPVTEAEKWSALAASRFAIVASQFESLSLALLEAWAMGRGALVNGASAVLVGQSRRANAGLWYGNEGEFEQLVAGELFGHADHLGRNGRAHLARHNTPEHARASLRAARAAVVAGPGT